MPAIPVDTIDKLERTWTSISAATTNLTEEQWKSPTDCPGWSVQDHLAHLIGTERKLQGLPAAPDVAPAGDHVRNPMGQFNENEVDARRHMAGIEVLAEWNELVALRVATLRAADADYFAQPASTPTGPGTVADFLHIRVLDNWIHEQDIRRALDRPGHRDGAAAEHTIDRLLRTVPIVVGKRAGAPEGETVVIELTGPVHRTINCTVRDGRAAFDDAPPPSPLATIAMDSDTFVVLATGRASASDRAACIALSGDQALGQRVVDNLNMMI